MNQILETDLTNNSKIKNKKKKTLLFLQLLFSSLFLILICFFVFYNNLNLSKKELYSNQILENYNIAKLYTNLNNDDSHTSTFIEDNQTFNVIGIIEIPIINLYYPVFSNYSDELLKISPCKFYGPKPGNYGNLCIAGHNYDNDKFFSKLSSLKVNDEIILYDNYNNKFSYFVSDKYEVNSNNLSPIYSYDNNLKQLTLITCNNFNNNRIIIEAFCK